MPRIEERVYDKIGMRLAQEITAKHPELSITDKKKLLRQKMREELQNLDKNK